MAEQRRFLADELQPKLDAAVAGHGHVLLVDAAHFVFATSPCHLWSILRVHVRAASGPQRLSVPGAWDAATGRLRTVTGTTVVNAQTMCELLRAVAAQGLAGPVTMVLDNARHQRNAAVMALAAGLDIELLFLPSYSPNPNPIERLWAGIAALGGAAALAAPVGPGRGDRRPGRSTRGPRVGGPVWAAGLLYDRSP